MLIDRQLHKKKFMYKAGNDKGERGRVMKKVSLFLGVQNDFPRAVSQQRNNNKENRQNHLAPPFFFSLIAWEMKSFIHKN